jgi:hypothetical protein
MKKAKSIPSARTVRILKSIRATLSKTERIQDLYWHFKDSPKGGRGCASPRAHLAQ